MGKVVDPAVPETYRSGAERLCFIIEGAVAISAVAAAGSRRYWDSAVAE